MFFGFVSSTLHWGVSQSRKAKPVTIQVPEPVSPEIILVPPRALSKLCEDDTNGTRAPVGNRHDTEVKQRSPRRGLEVSRNTSRTWYGRRLASSFFIRCHYVVDKVEKHTESLTTMTPRPSPLRKPFLSTLSAFGCHQDDAISHLLSRLNRRHPMVMILELDAGTCELYCK